MFFNRRNTANTENSAMMMQLSSLGLNRGARLYATDGPVGVLRQVVVDETTGAVSALVVTPENTDDSILMPVSLVTRGMGSSIFLSISRAQFLDASTRAPRYQRKDFTGLNARNPLGPVGATLRGIGASAGSTIAPAPARAEAAARPFLAVNRVVHGSTQSFSTGD